MKIILSLLSLQLLAGPRVIELGEIRIYGDVERPTVSFVIPRAQLDFLDEKGFLDKKNWVLEITESVKSDIFKVQ
jgi:hypothetical protein